MPEQRALWRGEFKKVQQCQQRQDSTGEQLADLVYIANRFGFYDAADYLKELTKDVPRV